MLGVGWTEMLVIGVVALIVIGPKDLPMVMQRVGRFAGMIRRMGNEFSRELNKTTGLNEVKNLRDSITAPLRQTTDEIRREFNAMTSTGVKPTGALAPKDPKAESVVAEIHEAAGMTPPAAAPSPAPAETAPEPVKAARRPRAKKAADTPPQPEPVKPAKRPRAAKAAAEPSPAPQEAAAPARKATTRRKPAASTASAPKRVRKPKTAKPDGNE